MSYAAALDRLHARVAELHTLPGQPRRKFRLEEMQTLVAALGHPQQRFRSVLIAGTNGKGSTSATLSAILLAAGYRSGLYTSPHLDRVNERIRIAGTPISDADFARHYFQVDDCAAQLIGDGRLPGYPSFFETLTALAFSAFAEASIDLAVLEVGMGGRLDATNVVDPLVSVITDVSLDHMEWLGHTLPEIAREKAGILRPSGTLVTLPQHPQANQAIGEVATALHVRTVSAAEYVPAFAPDTPDKPNTPPATALRNRYPVTVLGQPVEVDSPLSGAHQRRNIALAIAAAVELARHHGFRIAPAHIEAGIRQTRWPGRLETIHLPGKAEILLDVAHNPAGAWALRAALSSLADQPPRRKVLVFGCMQDKAYEEMAQILFPLFDLIVATPVPSPRSATADEILAAAEETGVPALAARDGHDALQKAWDATSARDRIVIAGSVYLVGELRPRLVPAEPAP